MAVGFDCTEFDRFTKDMIDMAQKKMPKKLNKFMNSESNKLTSKTKKEANSAIEKRSGSYHSSIKKRRTYKKNGVYSGGTYSSDRKSHLLELGHEQVIGRGPRKGEKVGIVAGRNVFKAAADGFENEFNKDLGELVDEVAKELTK